MCLQILTQTTENYSYVVINLRDQSMFNDPSKKLTSNTQFLLGKLRKKFVFLKYVFQHADKQVL